MGQASWVKIQWSVAVCLGTSTTDFKFVTAKCEKKFLKPNHPECCTHNY